MLEADECLTVKKAARGIIASEKKLSPDERAQFVVAKKKELGSFFTNDVWEFATSNEISAERCLPARWVLKW